MKFLIFAITFLFVLFIQGCASFVKPSVTECRPVCGSVGVDRAEVFEGQLTCVCKGSENDNN